VQRPIRAPRTHGKSFEEEVMQVLKNLGAVLVLGVVVAACGGGAAPTQAPGATQSGGGGGGTATQAPAATDGGGNGGNGGGIGTQFGKVTYTVTGPVQASGELGFIPQASMFGGDQGSVLNFGDTDMGGTGASVVSIVIDASGAVLVSYAGPAGQVPAASCTTSDWNIGAGNASGKFECTAATSITASGAAVAGGNIKGEFTAHT
jgi:hypothetical protein